jgi:hemerythrin-like domain-containing protein
VLKELIEHHVKEEEGDLFPQVEKAMSKDELEALGEKMEKRFDDALKRGYAALLPQTYEQTAADLSREQEEAAE